MRGSFRATGLHEGEGRLGLTTAFTVSLWLGCSSQRPVPEPSASPAASGSRCAGTAAAAPSLDGGAAAPDTRRFTSAEPPRFATVLRDAVVLQIGLQGARLKEPVELLNVPDDADSTYLARRAVDEAALPDAIRAQRGAAVTLLKAARGGTDAVREELTSCSARLGTISAYTWASEEQPWAKPSQAAIARKTFDEGTRYLAAEIEGGACPLRWWAMFASEAEVRFWRAEPASAELGAQAVAALNELPDAAARQSEYAAFVSKVERIRQQVEAERAKGAAAQKRLAWYEPSPLPASWLELSGTTQLWKVVNDAAPDLVVGLFERHVAEIVPARAGAGRGEERLLFETTQVVVWRHAGRIDSVESVVSTLHEPTQRLGGFELRGAVSAPGGLPALLFNAYYVNGVLRPSDGKYAVDESLMLTPAAPGKPR